MNTFEYSFYIGDKLYNLYVDSSRDEWKRIVINNKEIINEKNTLWLKRKAYMIYYPIDISGNELVVSIDDTFLVHTYNVYLNNVSLIDDSLLDKDYNYAVNQVSAGIKKYIKDNWVSIMKKNIIGLIASIFGFSFLYHQTIRQLSIKLLLIFVSAPIFIPVFIIYEWWHYKNIIKNYKHCFRPKQYL